MNKTLIILVSVFISFFASAQLEHTASATTLPSEIMSWKNYVVSGRIDPTGEDVTKGSINDVFKNVIININNTSVTVSGVCQYEYSKETMTPLKYWQSQKTAELYKSFLSDYNVKVNDKISLITPINPSIGCPYPFSYFIEVDHSLVFILKNRAIVYYQNAGSDASTSGECSHKDQTPEQIFESGDIDECHYKGLNILDSYKQYRDGLANDSKRYLQENIILNKNSTMQCDDGCIAVEYKWDGSGNLFIKQKFEGGETEISFSKEEQGSRVLIKSFSD